MEIEIKFNELERFSFLKKEISSFFTEEFIVVDSFVRERRWAHATLDDKQIFESDAINLLKENLGEENVKIQEGLWQLTVNS